MAFGKITHNGPTQQDIRTRHASEALDKDDQRKAPVKHQEKVQAIREREYGKQTSGWGGGSDNVRKVT
jgi:hypothetical protein